jgi:hypothetical protein
METGERRRKVAAAPAPSPELFAADSARHYEIASQRNREGISKRNMVTLRDLRG